MVAAIEELTARMAREGATEALLIERGKRYWQLRDVPHCFADYDAAIALNSESPAVHLRQMCEEILAFYNKDMYNP